MSSRAFQRHGPDSSLPGLQLPDNRRQDASYSPTGSNSDDLVHLSHDGSRHPSPFEKLPHPDSFGKTGKGKEAVDDDSDFSTWDDDVEDDPGANDIDMPSDLRPGRSSQNLPLLAGDKQGDYDEESAPTHTRPSRFRERDSEALAKQATKKRYTYAACFLVVSLISFAVQTETAVYIQHNLGWKKAYCMLYVVLRMADTTQAHFTNTSPATSPTAPGPSSGQPNSSSSASKNGSNPGPNSGAATSKSSAQPPK
jgi:hypothetical protein